jgi:hypothetical protein
MTVLLKTAILDRLQCWKKNKFWGCLVGILPLSWIPKSWRTLPDFYWLLIQPYWNNSLGDTEFCASAKLLKLNWTARQLEETKFWNLSKSKIPGLPNTISVGNSLCFLIVYFITPNGQWLSYGYQNMAGLLTQGNLNRLDLSAQIRILAKFCHDLPRNIVYKKCH